MYSAAAYIINTALKFTMVSAVAGLCLTCGGDEWREMEQADR